MARSGGLLFPEAMAQEFCPLSVNAMKCGAGLLCPKAMPPPRVEHCRQRQWSTTMDHWNMVNGRRWLSIVVEAAQAARLVLRALAMTALIFNRAVLVQIPVRK
jgi:hypothetical protein